MRNIARLSDNDRRELFRNTADKMGLNDAIVEKDFWVCFTLDYLFHRSPWKESITFKGGTSLSKAFHLISRFSEDIDLILDWRVLGYGKDEPWEKRSNTKQAAFNKEANARAEVFLSETFCPAVKSGLSQEIGCEANVYIDKKDKQTVIFAYPRLFANTATLQVIRLEIVVRWQRGLLQKQRRSNHTRQNIIRRFLSKKKPQSLPLPRNGPSGKKPQSCTMKRTDRNIWKCRSGIPDIIMISTAWLQHRSKKLLFPGWIS